MPSPAPTSVKGPESIPFSLMEKKVGKGCAKWLKKKAAKMKRYIGPQDSSTPEAYRIDNPNQFEKRGNYQPYQNTTAAEIYYNVLENLDELCDINPRNEGLAIRGDFNLQDVGVIPPTTVKRAALGLKDPMDNDHFVASLDAVIELLKEGVRYNYPTEKAQKEAEVIIKLKKTSGRGYGCDCAAGSEANEAAHNIILPAIAKAGNIFYAEDSYAPSLIGIRRSFPGLETYEDGRTGPKRRESWIFKDRTDSTIIKSTHNNGSDGFDGVRPRMVNMVDLQKGLPQIGCNAAAFDNLSPKAKDIFKGDPYTLHQMMKDEEQDETDFSQFEFTIPRNLRNHIFDALYSDRAKAVAQSVDIMPIAGVYTSFSSTDGRDADYYWWFLDRFNDPELAELFQHLMSGTGDTSLIGKIVGLASLVHHFCKAVEKTPNVVLGIGDPDADCLGRRCLRNSGDDAKVVYGKLRDAGYSTTEVRKVITKFRESLVVDRVFDITIEDPGKYLGVISHKKDPSDPYCKAHALTHDDTTMFSGAIMPEQSWNSPVRGLPVVGTYERLLVYRSTLVGHGVWTNSEFSESVKLILDIIDAPVDNLDDLKPLAEAEFNEYMNSDGMKAEAAIIQGIVKKLDIPSISALDYKVTSEEIQEKLTQEEKEALWITIDPKFTTGIDQFLKV